MKFSALNADFNSPSCDPLGSKRPMQSSIKNGYTSKKWLFYRFSIKPVQMDADILLIITSTGDKLFNGVNIDELEWPWTPKIEGFSVFCNFQLWCIFHKWIVSTWLEIDLDNLQTETAKAVARLKSFAHITCICL